MPVLPTHVHGRDEFMRTIETLFEFYDGVDYPVRISAFGAWASEADFENPDHMIGGVMFGTFSGSSEMIGSVRTHQPLPDVFDIVQGLRQRLLRRGKLIGYLAGDITTHVLTVPQPGYSDQLWDYGIIADDARAILLFLQYDCASIRRSGVSE